MKEDNSIPPSNDDDEPPLDDYGIDLDRMLEVCEKMIERLHEKYVEDNSKPKTSTEIKDVVQSLESLLNVTRTILGIDDVINSAMYAISQGASPDIGFEEDPEDPENPEEEIDGE